MKKNLLPLILGLCIGLIAFKPACAQLCLDANVGYGVPSEGSRSSGIWGGSVALKYYFSAKLAVGARVRTYVETLNQRNSGLGGRLTAITIPVMGTVEYHPVDTDLNPYVGLEAGVIPIVLHSNLDFNGRNVYNDTSTDINFGFAPKLGVSYDITQGLSVIAEALYNVGFVRNQAGDTQLNLRNSSKFLTFHTGISFTFGNRFD